ncbi:hypothetical protein F2Q68_00046270 [Brassica cretica]|uniref:Uncharacterized protein n=1 Tax=Brassica cretica TaxID=69181 RepID=A0A8S9LM47_BRACR|nr:hypothetical protein F2Q68_00046270 [Brassica cretica]
MNFSRNLLEGQFHEAHNSKGKNALLSWTILDSSGSKKYVNKPHVPNPTSHQSEELSEAEEQVLNWIAAAIAYGPVAGDDLAELVSVKSISRAEHERTTRSEVAHGAWGLEGPISGGGGLAAAGGEAIG